MAHNNDILNELSEWPLLSQISRKSPYAVPQGYFEELFNTVNQQVISFSDKKMPFSAPDQHYFEGLTSAIMSKIKTQDAEYQLNISKTNPFTVPAGYFNDLPQQVLQQVSQPAKVISIQRRVYRWVGAVAAAVLLFFAGNQFLKTTSADATAEYFTQLENLPTDELMVFAANQGMDTAAENISFLYVNDDEPEELDFDVEESLSAVSTEELEQYLYII